jgi:hypothetical protein
VTSASLRRGLLLAVLLAVVTLAVVDLFQTDSLLRRAWAALTPDRSTPAQQGIEGILRGRGRPVRP